ncbi:MAG TPA: hypothetical protein VIV35_08455 [Chitinophagaceae bacterium]
MDVHAHTHAERKKWTHYLWEFLMLFLAVTLGFFAENCREHYIEKHRVKQYARSLIYDLEKDIAMINLIVFRIKRNVRITDSLSSYLKNKSLSQIRNIDLFVLSAADRYPPYSWTRATLEQIKNSGSLRYFSNYDIVRDISSYDAQAHHMDEDQKYDDELASHTSETKCRLIRMNYSNDLTIGLDNNIDSVMETGYLKELLLKDTTELITKDINAIYVFLNEKLNIRKNLSRRTEIELPRLKKAAVSLIQLLKKEYDLK